MDDYVERLRAAVLEFDIDGVEKLAKEAVEHGLDPLRGVEEGLAAGIREVGRRFGEGELFLPELVMAAETMRAGVAVLQPLLTSGARRGSMKRVLLATVQDDIHEIGKNLVGTLLVANGYEVIDMGVNQPAEDILAKAREVTPDVIGISALMTTSMPRMKEILRTAEARGVREASCFIIGGAPVTDQYAKEIGSDGTSGDASGAVQLVQTLLRGPRPSP